MKCFAVILITLLTPAFCHCQNSPEKDDNLTRLVEELTGLQEADADYESSFENLMQVLANPIDLNTVSKEELRALHLLSEKQITEFLQYRDQQGEFISLYELQAIPEFDLITVQKLRYLVKNENSQNIAIRSLPHRMLLEKNNYLITRYEHTLETKSGFTIADDPQKKFSGSSGKTYMRYRSAKPNDYSIGFTGEKDAGEQFIWRPQAHQYGFDFVSYHLQLKNKSRFSNIIIGDFQCQIAQGLMLGGAFGLGKGAETITTTRRSNVGLLPYNSVNEAGFYRGAGVTYQLSRAFSLTGFYSSIKRDATIQNDSAISSFQYTGLHRNQTELSHRKEVTEKSYAAVLNYKRNDLDAGLIFHTIRFGQAIDKETLVYNQFTFEGNSNTNLGGFLNYTRNNFNFFSEAAKSLNGGAGVVAGVLSAIHHNIDMAIMYRKYDRNFYSFYANAFSENAQPQNETGIYWGWKYSWKRKYTMAGYTDLFYFPWLGFRRYARGAGYEWLLRVTYQPARNILLYAQAREESKPRNTVEDANLYQVDNVTRRNYWLLANYSLSKNLSLKTRAQFNSFFSGGHQTNGMVLIQDVNYSVGKFQISARHALFEAEDYENRHYVYENDAWMAFSLPAYYGVGVRNYILLEYKASKNCTLWLRCARTRYTDRDIIGSGVDAIDGNVRNDIKFQTLFRF